MAMPFIFLFFDHIWRTGEYQTQWVTFRPAHPSNMSMLKASQLIKLFCLGNRRIVSTILLSDDNDIFLSS